MKTLKIVAGVIFLSLAILNCNLPTRTTSPKLPQTTSSAAESEVVTSPSINNNSSARLTENDLPIGFRELTEQELTDLGLSSSFITNAFGEMFSDAQPQNFAAFTNTTGNFEVIVSSMLAPLTLLESAAIDLYLKDPQRLSTDLASSAGVSEFKIDDSGLVIGNASSSATFSVPDAPLDMTGNLTIFRHEKTLSVVMIFFPAGTQPTVDSSSIAEIIDSKLTNLE